MSKHAEGDPDAQCRDYGAQKRELIIQVRPAGIGCACWTIGDVVPNTIYGSYLYQEAEPLLSYRAAQVTWQQLVDRGTA